MSKQLLVKLLIGVPASGKSTWAKEFIAKNPKWVRIGRDEFRYMLKNVGWCEPNIESLITSLMENAIVSALSSGLNVIIDNTNLKKEYIDTFCRLVETYASVEFMYFPISLQKALERDKIREKSVGEDVIKRMMEDWSILVDSFDSTPRKQKPRVFKNPPYDGKKSDIILCDIDGTLAHMNGKRGPFDWNKVFVDDVDVTLKNRLRVHAVANEEVVLLSGRDESCRKETEDWLEYHEIPYSKLIMRKENDFRKDSIIKKEIYFNQIEPQHNVLFIYDDRDQVVKMWRSLGLKCFQVEPGFF